MTNFRATRPAFILVAMLSLLVLVVPVFEPSASASLLGALDTDTGICANIGSGYDRPSSYPDGWPQVDSLQIGSPPTLTKVSLEGGATNWHCRTDTGLTTGGQSCAGWGNGQSLCAGGVWSSTAPVGTRISIGKQDIETRINGSAYSKSLVSVDWDFDGNGTFETTDAGPWLAAVGTSSCSGSGCYYSTRETRSTYFEGKTSFATVGAHTVHLRARYSDGSSELSTGIFTATADAVTAAIGRSQVSGGVANATAPVLTNSEIYLSAAASTSTSGYFSKYEWDLNGDGSYEIDGGVKSTLTTSFMTAGVKIVGVRVTSRGGSSSSATMNIEVRLSPPIGEPGVSINDGSTATNAKSVMLNLTWPEYATEARVSNDGGFAASKTKTVPLSALVEWELDDTVKGVFTKVVYVRFNGSGIDNTKTYSDDVILDTTAPTINSSSAVATSSKIEVKIEAVDDITGVETVEIDTGSKVVSKEYSRAFNFSLSEAGMAVSESAVFKSSAKSLRVRVRDGAGNWAKWQSLTLSGKSVVAIQNQSVTKTLAMSVKKPVTGASIAKFAKLNIPKSSKVSLSVASSFKKFCQVRGTSVKGLKPGLCKVSVRVKSGDGKVVSKLVSLRISK